MKSNHKKNRFRNIKNMEFGVKCQTDFTGLYFCLIATAATKQSCHTVCHSEKYKPSLGKEANYVLMKGVNMNCNRAVSASENFLSLI